VLFLTYFMLLSDQLFKRKLVEIVGTLSQKKVTVTVLEDIARQIEQFLIIQLATSSVVAVATGVALGPWGYSRPHCGDCLLASSIRFRTMVRFW